ncbi:NAD(P)(+) transhydrogenase (Re/Si-specific) subunit beta [Streptomyces sp. NPDC014983]|uniref:NAD(P)(+) transhydrogenase (Re/Si-specific) subunit beta n=1 Tax=Streptomyces sp. NPDC014983 TaxID=3364933 RepID=UPI0036FC9D3C
MSTSLLIDITVLVLSVLVGFEVISKVPATLHADVRGERRPRRRARPIVPGYGLAVAHAEHEVAALARFLGERGTDVAFAIHPVAGRMPGHMNVLLTEANVPYERFIDMEQANARFAQTDVALVVGANDVTNPAARRPGTAISGMPILDVDAAKSVVVIKRSLGHGYAGIDNDLFTNPRTSMFFTDAKAGLTALLSSVRTLAG